MAHMIFKNKTMVDLDALVLDGTRARTWDRDKLEGRLRSLGVQGISTGQGRDSMLELYAVYLKNWGLGNGSEPQHVER